MMEHRIYDLDTEKILLGVMILADPLSDEKSAILTLSEEDFYSELNKEIVTIAKESFKTSANYDMITIPASSEKITFDYMVELTEDSFLYATSFQNLYKRVKELSEVRKVVKETHELTQGKIGIEDYKMRINNISLSKINEAISNQELVMKAYEKIANFDRDVVLETGIKTGFKKIDDRLLINKKDFIVLAGRQSTGKTAFVLNLINNNPGKSIYYHSNDATKDSLMERLLGIRSFQNTKNHSKIDFTTLYKAAIHFSSEKVYFGDEGKTAEDVLTRAREIKKQHGLDLIVVDYLQKFKGKGKSKYERVTNASDELDEVAKILDVPIIVVSALSRESAKQKAVPMMEDLKDSGDIEFYAKAIIFLHSQFALTGEGDPNEIQFICAKQKEGETFKETVYFNKPTLTYSEYNIHKNRTKE
jgi:replicative DNA helicase